MTDTFLPNNYDVPTSTNGYMRLQDGVNRLRILTSPILGWVYWVDSEGNVRQKGERPQKGDKPMRVPYSSEHPTVARHFWAMVVYNYADKAIQILEITQSNIQKTIKAFTMDEDLGSPLKYDLKITRKGTGIDTEYTIIPGNVVDPSDEITTAFTDTKIDLQKLFSGENPFEVTPAQEKAKAKKDFPDKEEEIDPSDIDDLFEE